MSCLELSKELGFSESEINDQLDVLWKNGSIFDNSYAKEIKYFITSEGLSIVGQESILYQGLLSRSQILNNWSSSIVQVVLVLIALVTVIQNFTTIGRLDQRLILLEQLVQKQEVEQVTTLKETQLKALDSDTLYMDGYPTSSKKP
jgi:uncharacterized membrane protein YcjF (UPF0283 family)